MFASDAVESVRSGLAGLAAEDRRPWTRPAQTQRLLELRQLQERLDAEVMRCVGDWDAAAAWAESPGLGPKSWLASNARMTRPSAERLLASARLVHGHAATPAAPAPGGASPPPPQALGRAPRGRAEPYA